MTSTQQPAAEGLSKEQWTERFVRRMQSLQTPLARRTNRTVEAAWRDAGDIAPEEVAEVYAAERDEIEAMSTRRTGAQPQEGELGQSALTLACSRPQWVAQFADALQALHPSLSVDEALTFASTAHVTLSSMPPREAAQRSAPTARAARNEKTAWRADPAPLIGETP